MSTGLFFASARSLGHQPNAPTAIAIKELLMRQKRELQPYIVMQYGKRNDPAGLALSLLTDLTALRRSSINSLAPLPPLPVSIIIDVWHDELSVMISNLVDDVAKCNEIDEDYELPPEFRPVKMDDGFPQLPDDYNEDDICWDTGEFTDWDSQDLKNAPDFDPDQDPEKEFFTYDVHTWVRADEHESLRGVKPRVYERLYLPITDELDMYRKEPSLTAAHSTLAPYLLVQEIPMQKGVSLADADEQFARMFYRYAYLRSNEYYLREFTCLCDDYGQKKREVEYWWRKNGWEGVIPEFFKHPEAKILHA
ncbi:MAG: hypothetical protein Q9186_005061 [Xanthomendoza sp. 1 TL-2023]